MYLKSIIVTLVLTFVSFSLEASQGVPVEKTNFDWVLFSSFVAAFAAVINNAFIVWFFLSDKRSKKKQLILSAKLYWFRTVILENNMDRISILFETCIKIVNECENLKKQFALKKLPAKDFETFLKKQYEVFYDEKRSFGFAFTDILSIIDEELGQSVAQFLEGFADQFTNDLSFASHDLSNYDYPKCRDIVYQGRSKLLSLIYNFEMSMV